MVKRELETFEETAINGPGTRRWFLECTGCQESNSHRIARLGIDEAVDPCRRVRMQPCGQFFPRHHRGDDRILLVGY